MQTIQCDTCERIPPYFHQLYTGRFGEVTEWLKVHAWKACVRE